MLKIPSPDLQVDFAKALFEIRTTYLQEALRATVAAVDIAEQDRQLSRYVPKGALSALAVQGIRGELMFPVPLLLAKEPRLVGYYRLLYGFSQKEFYTSKTGISRFQAMEKRGILRSQVECDLSDLCRALVDAGVVLLNGLSATRITSGLLDDLSLLTLGPQLRGGANVRKGADSLVTVFETIEAIVRPAILESVRTRIRVKNAAGRIVLIEFAADPDIIIREEMAEGSYRDLIAIEVKGGSDFSNIHNRIGEAEKSHQKAKAAGYVECWTIINVDGLDLQQARKESPSTNQLYRISHISAGEGEEYQDFRNRIISLTGIPH